MPSKLEAYLSEIIQLRTQGTSYRAIATYLLETHGYKTDAPQIQRFLTRRIKRQKTIEKDLKPLRSMLENSFLSAPSPASQNPPEERFVFKPEPLS